MTFYLKEEFLSFDHFDIWDEQDQLVYSADREFFTFGKKLNVDRLQKGLCTLGQTCGRSMRSPISRITMPSTSGTIRCSSHSRLTAEPIVSSAAQAATRIPALPIVPISTSASANRK